MYQVFLMVFQRILITQIVHKTTTAEVIGFI